MMGIKRIMVVVSGGFHGVPARRFAVPEHGYCSRRQSLAIWRHVCPSYDAGCTCDSLRSCVWETTSSGRLLAPPQWFEESASVWHWAPTVLVFESLPSL